MQAGCCSRSGYLIHWRMLEKERYTLAVVRSSTRLCELGDVRCCEKTGAFGGTGYVQLG